MGTRRSFFVEVGAIMGVCFCASLASAQVWVARYDGPGHGPEVARAVEVDGSGNVYVTGYSWGGAATDWDYATVKYDSNGVEQWVARYNGPADGEDWPFSLEVDPSGNVYVTGRCLGDTTANEDYATVKYDADGVQQWVAYYNNPVGNGYDEGKAVALDASGNVYVTGNSAGNGWDCATVKYDLNGVEQWVHRYDGPANDDDKATDITVDNLGYVYITGRSMGVGTERDYVTIKYNPDTGVPIWVSRYNNPSADSGDGAYSIAVDGSRNVYVTGKSFGLGTDEDYVTVKYDSLGAEQWVARYDGPGHGPDKAYRVLVDESGNVYIAGESYGDGTDYDYATIKYDPDGFEQWVARYNGPGNGPDTSHPYGGALAMDELGNVYTTGASFGLGTDFDYATVKYNSDGVEQWAARYDGPADSSDDAWDVTLDGLGNVYVTGRSIGVGTDFDFATIKYRPTGPGVNETGYLVPNPPCPILEVWPNPTTNLVLLEITGLHGPALMKVHNISGRMVRELPVLSFKQRLDLGEFPSGIYFISLDFKGARAVSKVVKVQ